MKSNCLIEFSAAMTIGLGLPKYSPCSKNVKIYVSEWFVPQRLKSICFEIFLYPGPWKSLQGTPVAFFSLEIC